jgi:hypothetical protein
MKRLLLSLAALTALLLTLPAHAATIAYWQLDETSGALLDEINNYDLAQGGTAASYGQTVLKDPVPNPDAGPFEDSSNPKDNAKSINFASAGYYSYADGGDDQAGPLDIKTNASFTFEGFFNIPDPGAGSTDLGVIGGTRSYTGVIGLGGYDGWMVWVRPGGYLGFIIDDEDGGIIDFSPESLADPSPYATVDDGQTHHFALVWNHDGGTNSGGKMSLYLDGSFYGAEDDIDLRGSDNVYNNDDFAVGNRSASNSKPFPGRLDELRFSDEVLEPKDFLIPEPSALVLLLAGLIAVVVRRRW